MQWYSNPELKESDIREMEARNELEFERHRELTKVTGLKYGLPCEVILRPTPEQEAIYRKIASERLGELGAELSRRRQARIMAIFRDMELGNK